MDFAILVNSLAVVVQLEGSTDGVWHTVVGVDLVSVDNSGERRALSGALNLGSNAERFSVHGPVRVDSGVAHKWVSWSAWWVDGRVEASVGVAAASGDSVLESGAVVHHVQVAAHTRWIASVEGGSSGLSHEGGGDRNRHTLSLASLPSSRAVGGSVDKESRVARDREVVEWREWDGGVDDSLEVGLSNVAVVHVVAAASVELWVVRLHAGARIVELQGTAEGVWDTGEEGHVVRSNTGVDRGALSVAKLLGSGLEAWDVGGVESDVALEWWGWDSLSASWVEASISITAASGDSGFRRGTVVVNSELVADGRWIAGVERSGVEGSVDGGVDADRGALSVADSELDWGLVVSIDDESGWAGDRELTTWTST